MKVGRNYNNPAIKGFDENGEPLGDPFSIMFYEQQRTMKDVYPSRKELKGGVKMTKGNYIYRNPAKRASDFANQLKKKNAINLTDTQKSFRSGYLTARKDSANAYKLKNKKISPEQLGLKPKKK